MKNSVNSFEEGSISLAWARAFLSLFQTGAGRMVPLIVTINNIDDKGQPFEIPAIRSALDTSLRQLDEHDTNSTANTIFPLSFWNSNKDREELYTRYKKAYPVIKRLDHSNKYGQYFHRLIAFGQRHTGTVDQGVNQLEHIISTYKQGTHRVSTLQASILDPFLDLTAQRQRGFPCLQQVSFVPDSNTQELTIIGYYAKQFVFDRAYGNYLGLCRLGYFVAHELNLRFSKMTCVAGVAELASIPKRDLSVLASTIDKLIESLGRNEER